VAAAVAQVLLVVMVLLPVLLDLLLASLEALWNMRGEVHLTLIHQHLETVLELQILEKEQVELEMVDLVSLLSDTKHKYLKTYNGN
jgi:uncharacterized protein YpuA (DUF1002 family)